MIALYVIIASVAAALTARLRRGGVLDRPTPRSLHARPVPRTGGLAVTGAIAFGWLTLAIAAELSPRFAWIAAAAAAIAAVSYADDRASVSARTRLLVHTLAAIVVVAAGFGVERVTVPGGAVDLGAPIGAAFSILLLVWMTNLYNFMDGADGLAGGMTVIGFGYLGVTLAGADASAALVVASAALGFLPFNLAPARIFLGDVGSTTLGFLAGVFALHGEQVSASPLWATLLAFSPFVVDATVTLMLRLIGGATIWEPHLGHFYQRLLLSGWGHRRTAAAAYVLMAGCAATSLAVLHAASRTQWIALTAWALAYLAATVAISRIKR